MQQQLGTQALSIANQAPQIILSSGCIMFTPEGFADAVGAFPGATTVSDIAKPTASERFAAGVRFLCEGRACSK